MISVKICGITNMGDAYWATEFGAAALGFIFYPKSLRYIAPEDARKIIEKIPGSIGRVGVFVNQEIQAVKEVVSFCGLGLIQLHGDESPEYCAQFPRSSLIKAISDRAERKIQEIGNYPVRAILVDSREPGCYGGTGKNADWALALKVKKIHPIILAGGLNKENIRSAIETVGPHAVDINSGVETLPGKKNPQKIREIMEIIRATDKDEIPGNLFGEVSDLKP